MAKKGIREKIWPTFTCQYSECGRVFEVTPSRTKKGSVKFCSVRCTNLDRNMVHIAIGDIFDRWTVIDRGKRPRHWVCRCSCPLGIEKEVFERSLYDGVSGSCGCLLREWLDSGGSGVHFLCKSPEYNAWESMKARCYSPSLKLRRYQRIGITVCEEWRASFEAFFAYMGERPSPLHSLERIDNNGNYEPGNVKWALIEEQARNTSRNRWIEFNGERRVLADWARPGLTALRIRGRLNAGWSISDALTLPIQSLRRSRKILPPPQNEKGDSQPHV